MPADNSLIRITVTNKMLHQVGRVTWATAPSERHMVHSLMALEGGEWGLCKMCWESIRCDLGNAVPFPAPFLLVATQLLNLQNYIWAATYWVQPFPAANHVSCPARYSQFNKTGDIRQACYQKTQVGLGRRFQQLWKLMGVCAVGITDPASEYNLAIHIHTEI